MGVRTTVVHILASALLSACGTGAGSPPPAATDPTPTPPTPAEHHSPSIESAPYLPAHGDLRRVAQAFAEGITEYDAARESRLAFLSTVGDLATADALDDLRSSPRAHLPWGPMRARRERLRLVVTGISVVPSAAQTKRVIVTATMRIATDSASVLSFLRLTLWLLPTHDGWKVEHAEGPGL